jgi:single-stranded-DNA-specific exonuclease
VTELKWKQREPKVEYSPFDDLYEKLAAINGIDDIDRFLNPTSSELHSPLLLKNVKKATERIIKAIDNNENITIHSDVDYDGCASTAIIFRYLKRFTDNVKYIHAQRSSGHGISNYSIDDIPKETNLLIIVDSSSNETEACKEINSRCIDVIVLDHHEITEENPYCILVNPKQDDCEYPNKDASGGLICWKVCQVLDQYFNTYYANELADLAGLSVVADSMNMMNYENRAMANKALHNIQNIGLLTLIKAVGKNEKFLSCTDFLFSISPCITAATRFDNLEIAIRLLVSDSVDECKELSKKLVKLNNERKKIQTRTVKELKEKIGSESSDKCLVIVDSSIGKGFNGVIASDLASFYQRPVFILGESDENTNEYIGSFRSIDSIDMLEYLSTIPEATFSAGHAGAGGVGVLKSDLEKFKKSLNDGLSDDSFEQVIEYDLELGANEIDEDFIRQVNKFYRICGSKGFSMGKFLIEGLYVSQKELLGKEVKETVKISCDNLHLMKFKTDEKYFNNVPIYTNIKAIGSLTINAFYHGGLKQVVKTNQVMIDDYQTV